MGAYFKIQWLFYMKKFLTFIILFVMIFCFCGCKNNQGDTSIFSDTVIYEEIIINEDGTEITSSDIGATSDESNQDSTTSSDNSSDLTDSKQPIVIDYDTVVEIDICDDIIRGYLNATEPSQQFNWLNEYKLSVLDYQNLPLKWNNDGSFEFILYISENADFSNSYTIKSNSAVAGKTGICVPGKTYYWKVLGVYSDEPLGGGKIKIKDAPVRWVKIDGVSNVRDIGGWKTTSGKTVKYEKIYRGAMLDKITDTGLDTLKALGVKTDIDVRSTESWDTHNAVPKTGLNYYFLNTPYSYEAVLNESYRDEVTAKYQKMFELLSDESNYPVYLHCGGGTDRTGLDTFILNGLLGVSYEDLTRDYELTSYAGADRWRGNGTGGTFAKDDLIHENVSNSTVDATWGVLNKKFMESSYCTDGKLSTAIQNFLLDRGVTQEQIDSYKKIMLK